MAGTTDNPSILRFALLLGTLHWLVYLTMFSFQFKGLADSPAQLFAFGSLALSVVFIVCYFGTQGSKEPTWTSFFFFILFTAHVDLYLAMALLDVTDLGKFYIVTGEEYFKTSWGWASLAWDGTTHYLLQVVIVTGLLQASPRPLTRLFWCGSIINSMPVLLVGALSGGFSANIEPATVFNAPFVIAPLIFAAKTLKEAMRNEMPSSARPSRLFELLVAVGSCIVIIFHTIRAMAVFGSQNSYAVWWRQVEPEVNTDFARPQIMQNMFLFIYWHIFSLMESIYRVIFKRQSCSIGGAARYAAVFIAGCVAQAQFCHLVALYWKWESFSFKSNEPNQEALVYNIGLLVFCIFQAIVWNASTPTHREKTE